MPKKSKPTKSAFVRSLPDTMKASDVAAKAKAAGLKISAKHVYVIRSLDRRKALTAKIAQRKEARGGSAVPPKSWTPERMMRVVATDKILPCIDGTADLDKSFRQYVLHVGVAHAQRVLNEMVAAAQ